MTCQSLVTSRDTEESVTWSSTYWLQGLRTIFFNPYSSFKVHTKHRWKKNHYIANLSTLRCQGHLLLFLLLLRLSYTTNRASPFIAITLNNRLSLVGNDVNNSATKTTRIDNFSVVIRKCVSLLLLMDEG